MDDDRFEESQGTVALEPATAVKVRGARTHNLRNIDVDIPHGQLVVLTGPSGSGKSSLAFDTLFAEGQRQFIESLSVYARQFLTQLERPDVDSIEGLAPVVCIDQRPGQRNPRSTVATATEVYDFLRLLMARLGEVACHQCGLPIRQQTAQQVEETLSQLAEGSKLMLLTPMARGKRGELAEVFAQIRKLGMVRARVDGKVIDLEHIPVLDPKVPHTIEGVVDRIVVRKGSEGRLAESIQLALKHSGGMVVACSLDPKLEERAKNRGELTEGLWVDRLFSTLYSCPDCGVSMAELEPRSFSFNSPYGACPACDGLGTRQEFDPDLIIPDKTLSLAKNAVVTWRGTKGKEPKLQREACESYLNSKGFSPDSPLESLPADVWRGMWRGEGDDFLGLEKMLSRELSTATDSERKEELELFRGAVVCESCQGTRLRPEVRSVRFLGKTLAEIVGQSVTDAVVYFSHALELAQQDEESAAPSDLGLVGLPILDEIVRRLEFLEKVGLGYLTLERSTDMLSGGEFQRVRLATGIGSGLTGILYILDEPSIGLHPRDNDRLIESLRELQEQGNTVLVVEHDEATMRAADWLIDIGPGAGRYGGQLVAIGTPQEVSQNPASVTGRYLSGADTIALPEKRRKRIKSQSITIEGVTTNNLRNVTAEFPLGMLVGVTGVSGSGKSSLVAETFTRAMIRRMGGQAPRPGPFTGLKGASLVDRVVEVDQSPIGRSARSNAATYTGIFDEVRKLFTATKEARQLGFKANRFSFNVAGGRCENCLGQGVVKLEMHFLPDLYVPCQVCEGKRFNAQTLAVRFRGKSIADILAMPIEEATEFFVNVEGIYTRLTPLVEVGLGYLPLGQPSNTISGGEAQRIKLATELARTETGKTLYLLDEPTTGLHFGDVKRVVDVLQKLVQRGNSVVVVEHHLDVLKCCDWLIDLGPEGGKFGGEVLFAGTPEELALQPDNHTARFLREVLAAK